MICERVLVVQRRGLRKVAPMHIAGREARTAGQQMQPIHQLAIGMASIVSQSHDIPAGIRPPEATFGRPLGISLH